MSNISDIGFDVTQIEDAPSRNNTPDGVYFAEIEKCERKEDNGDTWIETQYRLIQNTEGKPFNSCAWERHTLISKNENQVKWGRIFFKRLIESAFGQKDYNIQDTDELLNKKVVITLKTLRS